MTQPEHEVFYGLEPPANMQPGDEWVQILSVKELRKRRKELRARLRWINAEIKRQKSPPGKEQR